MEREKSAMFLGLGLLIGGILILMFVLTTVIGLAANPGPFLQRQLPSSTQGPTAVFTWSSQNLSVTFTDRSQAGSSLITSYSWEFGDNATSTEQNPTHAYGNSRQYAVRLTVRDQNGKQSNTESQVNVQNPGNNNGSSNVSPNINFDIGTALLPVAIALLTTGLYVVSFLVGGSLVKAGWNLIRPRPETIRIRLKPRNWETGATAEVVPPGPTWAETAPAASPQMSPPPPPAP